MKETQFSMTTRWLLYETQHEKTRLAWLRSLSRRSFQHLAFLVSDCSTYDV